MREIIPGHRYALDDLKTGGSTILQFYQDPEIHGQQLSGPSTQEVLRAVIGRVEHLETEEHWPGNEMIVQRGREMIALFEMRALWFKVVKHGLAIERLPTGEDGHIQFNNGEDDA